MIFEVKDGCFGYDGKHMVLNHISYDISEKQVLSILGSNGVGKTTLLKCSLGLQKWSSGGSFLNDKNISEIKQKELWQNIGYVPQAKLSAFAYSVDEMVLLGRNSHLGMLEQPNDYDRNIADACMKKIGIEYLKGKLCSRISGGELQMVLIARALASDPKLLILDEPESNLDFKNQLTVLDTIKKLRDEDHISSIINTHYPEHAISISDKALILNKDGSSVFGEAKNTITEANLEKSFNVQVKIHNFSFENRDFTCVLPF